MRYDRDGFPIPAEFEPRVDHEGFSPPPPGIRPRTGTAPVPPGTSAAGTAPRRKAGTLKRWLLLGVMAGAVIPTVVVPEVMPAVRQMVVEWSLDQAAEREVGDDIPAAISHLDRAIAWHGDDARLICMRAMLRLQDRDAVGALADADRAAAMAPTSPQPHRVRALAHTVMGRADAALSDVGAVVDLAAPGDADALNLRAYTRALVGRELPEALLDIEQALERTGEESPGLLDTRGYVLHLLGRNQEAIDDLNRAIDGMQSFRRRIAQLRGRIDHGELEQRLRSAEHGLAVMHHHRAEACQAAGHGDQAVQDFEIARQKGFDPTRGIF